jgi:hypothetical protein
MTPGEHRVRWLALAAWVALAGAAPSVTVPEPSPSPALTGEAIYLRAVRAMRGAVLPPYVIFHEEVAARNLTLRCAHDDLDVDLHHGDQFTQYRVWFRSIDGRSISVEAPSGNRCEDAMLAPVGSPKDNGDLFGPKPSPTPDSGTFAPNGLPIIAAVRADAAHYYRITLVDQETFEGHPVYRLALHAYRNDMDFPLTGMLVDADTLLVRQASGELSLHMLVASGWAGATVTFDRAGPFWIVRDEHVEFAANAILVHVRAGLDVHGSDFSYPADLPGVFPSPSPQPTSSH